MNTRPALAFKLALLTALAEIVLIFAVTLRAAPADAPLYAGLLWALLKSAPLMSTIPWLLRGSARAAICLCFLLCFYFLAAVLTALAPPPQRWLGAIELVLICSGFVAGLLAARWARRPAASPATPPA